jgi:phage-related protein
MILDSLKKLAQDTIGSAKEHAEKAASTVSNATTNVVGTVRSAAPESLDSVVKSLTRTATGAVAALGETKPVRPIVEGVHTAVEIANRISRAAQAAREAFVAEPPGKPAPEADVRKS